MTEAGHILVVDDEAEVCALIARCLKPGGFAVDAAHSGADMNRLMARSTYDLVILDLNLQGEDGLELLRDLRQSRDVLVIIVTARGEPVDRVVGLELGADDYVSKPFEPRELLARVRSVLRRIKAPCEATHVSEKSQLRFHGWRVDLQARVVHSPDGEMVELTTAQFDVLSALARHPNRALTRDQLLDLARDRTSTPFDRSIDVHIGQLRKRIEVDRKNPQIIKTIHGIGYMFCGNVTTH